MKYTYDTFQTPLGEFSVALDANGAVAATAFGGLRKLRTRLRQGDLVTDRAGAAAARREIADYFAGRRREFTVTLAPAGTPFQQAIWRALRQIPYGQTTSYGALAAAAGHPGASRAVGRANATNPICLLIPCHRVIGRDGSLTGYAFGEDIKRALLELEKRGSAKG